MYSFDGGSTESLAKVMQKVRPPRQGDQGRRLRPHRRDAEAAPGRQHRIHDRPAALPAGVPAILQLFFWRASGSLSGPAEVDTGLKFIDKETVAPYVESKSRYEGTSTEAKVIPLKAGAEA